MPSARERWKTYRSFSAETIESTPATTSLVVLPFGMSP
jgi:hypothetical protein